MAVSQLVLKPFLQMRLATLLFLLLISYFSNAESIVPSYTSIFSFGDSYTDTGNSVAQAKFILYTDLPPYGMTYFGQPTGRCSNGRLVIDFIAQGLGLPFVPPYLSHNGSFIQGANFAVSGTTALDIAFFNKNNLSCWYMQNSSLDVQIGWFEALRPSLCDTAQTCKEYFSTSLFFVGEFGANDYTFMIAAGKSVAQLRGYVSKIIKSISNATERLIKQGIVNIVVPGLWPDGCSPSNLAQNTSRPKEDYEPQTGCLKDLNELSILHNSRLLKAITRLQEKYPHATIIYADFYSPVIEFIKSPKNFGFSENPLRACCGKGENEYNYNGTKTCAMRNVSACKNPSHYVNWDGIHLTENAYKIIAYSWLNGPYAEPPILSVANNMAAVM